MTKEAYVVEVLSAAARMLNAAAAMLEKADLAPTVTLAELKDSAPAAAPAATPAPAAPEAEKPQPEKRGPGRPPKVKTAEKETEAEKVAEEKKIVVEEKVADKPAMSEEDSLKELRTVAKVYVQRFANQTDGIKSFRELMTKHCGLAKIDDLVHAQRVTMLDVTKAELAKADEKMAAPVGAGVEV